MRASVKREKLLKNSKGQYRYLFNWIGGGFNDIWAKNIIEFMAEVKRRYPNSKVDYTTVHKATESSSREWDRAGNMMCW